MTEETIESTLRQRVNTEIVGVLGWPVQWSNTAIDVRDNESFIKVTNVWGTSEQNTAGRNPRFRDHGTLMIGLFTPVDAGDKAALDAAVIVRAAMRSISIGDLTLQTPSIQKLGAQGKWYHINIACPWYADNHPIN